MVIENLAAPLAALFVPGDRPDRFEKAATSGADMVIFDLEDAVSAQNKPSARDAVRSRLLHARDGMVRLNSGRSGFLDDDLEALYDVAPTAVMLAKAEMVEDITRLKRTFGPKTAIVLLIETALGLSNLPQMLRTGHIWHVAFGSLDYALDIGAKHSFDALLHARSEIVFQCRLAGIAPPVDGVTMNIKNAQEITDDSRRAAELGFAGKLAIHPEQIQPIRTGFRPTEDDRIWAEKVVAASKSAAVVQVDGNMADEPVVQRALRILDRSGK